MRAFLRTIARYMRPIQPRLQKEERIVRRGSIAMKTVCGAVGVGVLAGHQRARQVSQTRNWASATKSRWLAWFAWLASKHQGAGATRHSDLPGESNVKLRSKASSTAFLRLEIAHGPACSKHSIERAWLDMGQHLLSAAGPELFC